MELLVDALACFRLTHLTASDVLLEDLRDPITEWASRTHHRKIRYFASCPWCQSAHWAVVVYLLRRKAPKQWEPVAQILAFSAVSGLLSTVSNRD